MTENYICLQCGGNCVPKNDLGPLGVVTVECESCGNVSGVR